MTSKNKNEEKKNEVTNKKNDINSAIPGFDLSKYQATELDTQIVTKKVLVTIPVKKPNSQIFFRIKKDFCIDVYLFEDKEDSNKLYLVNKTKLGILSEQAKLYKIYLAVNTKNDPFLFPVRQPDETGNWNEWHRGQHRCIELAKNRWVRMRPNRSINSYDPLVAEGKLPEPEFPEMSLQEIFELAFKDQIIDNEEHPTIKRLRGLSA